jgi:hypothetical protein
MTLVGLIEEASMIRMFLVLALIVAGVVGLGFCMGWFHFSLGSATTRMRISPCQWTRTKSKRTRNKAVDKVQDLGQQAKDEVATTIQKAQE